MLHFLLILNHGLTGITFFLAGAVFGNIPQLNSIEIKYSCFGSLEYSAS